MTKLAIIYYSATGHGTAMAQRVARAAEAAGAEVRLRHVAETHDPASTKDLPPATGDALDHLARRVVAVAGRLRDT